MQSGKQLRVDVLKQKKLTAVAALWQALNTLAEIAKRTRFLRPSALVTFHQKIAGPFPEFTFPTRANHTQHFFLLLRLLSRSRLLLRHSDQTQLNVINNPSRIQKGKTIRNGIKPIFLKITNCKKQIHGTRTELMLTISVMIYYPRPPSDRLIDWLGSPCLMGDAYEGHSEIIYTP